MLAGVALALAALVSSSSAARDWLLAHASSGAAADAAAAAGGGAGGAAAAYTVEVRAWNEYTRRLGAAGEDYPWFARDGYLALVEPHRAHHFAACARQASQHSCAVSTLKVMPQLREPPLKPACSVGWQRGSAAS